MATFDDLHTLTLYYRDQGSNETGSDTFGDPTRGSATSYSGLAEGTKARDIVQAGVENALGYTIQTHTELKTTYLLFGPGDDGSDPKTGRHPYEVRRLPMSVLDGSSGVLYEAKV